MQSHLPDGSIKAQGKHYSLNLLILRLRTRKETAIVFIKKHWPNLIDDEINEIERIFQVNKGNENDYGTDFILFETNRLIKTAFLYQS